MNTLRIRSCQFNLASATVATEFNQVTETGMKMSISVEAIIIKVQNILLKIVQDFFFNKSRNA